jgi:hypothetical protein
VTQARSIAVLGGTALALVGLVLHESIRLDVVHVAVAAGAILFARPRALALASLALWLLGVLAAGSWLSLDLADNWLHFSLAVALLGLAPLVGGQDLADDLERDLGGRLSTEV